MKQPLALSTAFFLAGLALGGASLRAGAQKPGDVGFSYGDLRELNLRGKLIPLGEEMARKYGARTSGGGAEKQWVLASPEGQLYAFLDNGEYRKLVAAGEARTAVEVRARQFPRSMILEVTAFKALPAEAVRRRFHCGVCDIYTEDWGPCACCGKEMELQREK